MIFWFLTDDIQGIEKFYINAACTGLGATDISFLKTLRQLYICAHTSHIDLMSISYRGCDMFGHAAAAQPLVHSRISLCHIFKAVIIANASIII